jgi:5-methylcytosine-specific restriction endonuclease McrA
MKVFRGSTSHQPPRQVNGIVRPPEAWMGRSAAASKRRDPPPSVRDEVLREAGYKCANPTCRNVLTLQPHHMVWVKDGGGSAAINLIALCGHCHDLHTQGHIPATAISHWKGLLHALERFSLASSARLPDRV